MGMDFFTEGVMVGVREYVRESVIGFSFFCFLFGSFRRFPRGFYKNIASYSPVFPRLQAFYGGFCGGFLWVFWGFVANYRVNSGADGKTGGKTNDKTNGENVCENVFKNDGIVL